MYCLVVDIMDVGKFLIATLVFLFSIFLFFPLNDAVTTMTYTGSLKPLLQVFPFIFIVITAVFPIYFLVEGKEN